jgi:hypothetical protein
VPQTNPVGSAFAKQINDLDEAAFQARYGPWDPPEPAQSPPCSPGPGCAGGSRGLRPLLPGDPLTPGCEQLWARRDARQPWQLDLLLDRSTEEWVFKRDSRVRLPWPRALHEVDGVPHLRPELALLHKAHLDRPKDRADLAAARLGRDARAWLADTLDLLGHRDWAATARAAG